MVNRLRLRELKNFLKEVIQEGFTHIPKWARWSARCCGAVALTRRTVVVRAGSLCGAGVNHRHPRRLPARQQPVCLSGLAVRAPVSGVLGRSC